MKRNWCQISQQCFFINLWSINARNLTWYERKALIFLQPSLFQTFSQSNTNAYIFSNDHEGEKLIFNKVLTCLISSLNLWFQHYFIIWPICIKISFSHSSWFLLYLHICLRERGVERRIEGEGERESMCVIKKEI